MANITNGLGQTKVGVRVASGGGGAIDTDAQAFITAAAITDTTQQSAINTLVTQLKSYGIWTKLKAVYPFVGGSASAHKWNLKDPRDLDAAYRLVFNGGWTHSSTGAKPNGTTGYANPYYTNVTDNSSMWYYSRTNNTTNGFEIGVYNNPYSDTGLSAYYNGSLYGYIRASSNGYSGVVLSATTSQGFYGANRTSSTLANVWHGGIKKGTNTNTSSQDAFTKTLFIGAYNSNAGAAYFSNRESAFASIGDGLTDAEAANFYTAVQTFQTTLGRQVGVPIVADTDAQAFLNAAVITDQTQANAVTTLVTDLKSANIWSKMKAIYPFVGGTATAHKFNLKDPRDLDAAFRLTFSGGWTHSSTGALPNGTTAYADTKLKPSNIPQNSVHMSTYLRTTYSGGVDMGCSTNDYFFISANLGIGIPPRGPLNLSTYSDSSISLDTKAFYLASRTNSTTNKLFRNTSLISNETLTSVAPEAYNIYIGAGNRSNAGWAYTARQTSFASIGDGLTDAEAAAFYTAVQKYQTTLGRQV